MRFKSPAKKGQGSVKTPVKELGSLDRGKEPVKEKDRQHKGKEPCQGSHNIITRSMSPAKKGQGTVKSPVKELGRQNKGKEACQGSHNMTRRSMSPAKAGTTQECHLRSGKKISRPSVGQNSGDDVDERDKGKGKAAQNEERNILGIGLAMQFRPM
ncbi:internalin [Sesbania bispinosa]|nr:internalin [Sesbania bispinosa]